MLLKTNIHLFVTLAFCLFACNAHAQKRKKQDPYLHYNKFLELSASYKKFPLQLEVEVHNTTNLSTSAVNLPVKGSFFIQENAAYIRFGELEQIIEDSVAVLINHAVQQIKIDTAGKDLLASVKDMKGLALPAASLKSLSSKYNIKDSADVIYLTEKVMLPETNFPLTAVNMTYDAHRRFPLEVTTILRRFIIVSPEQFTKLQQEPHIKPFLHQLTSGETVFVKEEHVRIEFKNISHHQDFASPVTLTERVSLNHSGIYEPQRNYAHYRLSSN